MPLVWLLLIGSITKLYVDSQELMNMLEFTLNYIEEKLYGLVYAIKSRNIRGLTDYNVYCESFIRSLLNTIHNWNLQNANAEKCNVAGYDLIDEGNKIFVQVTSEKNKQKVERTLTKTDIPRYSGFTLYMFFISVPEGGQQFPFVDKLKTKANSEAITQHICFDKSHCLDITAILSKLQYGDAILVEKVFNVVKTFLAKDFWLMKDAETFHLISREKDCIHDQNMLTYLFEHFDTNLFDEYIRDDAESINIHIPTIHFNWNYIAAKSSFILYDKNLSQLFKTFMSSWNDAMYENEKHYSSRYGVLNKYYFFKSQNNEIMTQKESREYNRITESKKKLASDYALFIQCVKENYRVDFETTATKCRDYLLST